MYPIAYFFFEAQKYTFFAIVKTRLIRQNSRINFFIWAFPRPK